MPYGELDNQAIHKIFTHLIAVRLGKSGLKISKIILGCMTYGKYLELLIFKKPLIKAFWKLQERRLGKPGFFLKKRALNR